MRGLICAGGKVTRLAPLTKTINKHLLPVGNKPMIYYALEKMQEAGITSVLIVTDIDQCGSIVEQCGDGKEWNLQLSYKVQTEAGGIAQAISLAEDFANGDSLFVILGDNIFSQNVSNIQRSFRDGAQIFLKEVSDPERFGVAEVASKISMYFNQVSVVSIEEKPKHPKSNYAVTGIYIYDNTVFDKIRNLKKSARGELEVTDLNNAYLKENTLTAYLMDKDTYWTDAGTFESLYKAINLVYNKKKK
jgi:glucose-1-phosphate thymidylyltransferase